MKITQICDILRHELYNNYQYGFYCEGKKYTPDFGKGFDADYFAFAKSHYRIQNPLDTMREKIGTCIDAVLVMRDVLEKANVPNKIWLLHHNTEMNNHTILTFESEGKVVYLELTPQSNKPWYGKELLYNDEQSFKNTFQQENYSIVEVTDTISIGDAPDSLLQCL